MKRSSLLSLVLVSAFSLALSSDALASRLATPTEREAVAVAMGLEPACVTIRISTADESWGLLYPGPYNPDCAGANGAIVVELTSKGWRDRYEGAGFPFLCPVKPIPTPVARDLGICRPASIRVYVGRFGKLVVKPHRLGQGAHGFFDRLSWHRWGRSTTTARGVINYSDRYDQFVLPVRIRLSRVRYCGLKRVYTRITVGFTNASDTRRAPGIPGNFTVPACP